MSNFDPVLQAAALRQVLQEGELALQPAAARVRWDGGGRLYAHARSTMIDGILQAGVSHVFHAHGFAGEAIPVALVATGGYGQAELAPYSDIDLLFLLPETPSDAILTMVRDALYVLWDSGLKLGHAVRTVADCIDAARGDITIRTTLIQTRLIAGDAALHRALREAYAGQIAENHAFAFAREKFAESAARHAREGNGRSLLEPNLKDGRGGLRDLQTIGWVAHFFEMDRKAASLPASIADFSLLSPQELRHYERMVDFFWNVRVALHTIEARAAEQISFSIQPRLARQLGFGRAANEHAARRFMRVYCLCARYVIQLTQIVESMLLPAHKTAEIENGFSITDGRFDFGAQLYRKNAPGQPLLSCRELLELFRQAQIRGLDIHPRALRVAARAAILNHAEIRRDDRFCQSMRDIFAGKNHARYLRLMHDCGLLAVLLPEFAQVAGHMQYDLYHIFTVDEHTLRACEILEAMLNGESADDYPFAAAVIEELPELPALRFAMLLHDIAKGRGGDHSILGAETVRKNGARFGFSAEETELAAWLVREHLTMSNTAFRRDLESPRTIADFAALVETPERLRALLLLTAADITAVGPGRWTQWKSELLAQLYRYTLAMLIDGPDGSAEDEWLRKRLAAMGALLPDWSADEVRRYAAQAGASYFRSQAPEVIAWQARLLREAEALQIDPQIGWRVEQARGVTDLTVIADDRSGLFATLAGAISVSGGTIAEARIFTLASGKAIDVFRIQDISGAAFSGPDRLGKLKQAIEQALSGKLDLAQAIAGLKQPVAMPVEVFPLKAQIIMTQSAASPTLIVEVKGTDRPGLLYALTRCIGDLHFSIRAARISTYGRRAVDVFHIRELDGTAIADEARLQNLKDQLLSIVKGGYPDV